MGVTRAQQYWMEYWVACPASGGQPPEHNGTGADLMRIAIAKQLPDDDKKWLNIDDNE